MTAASAATIIYFLVTPISQIFTPKLNGNTQNSKNFKIIFIRVSILVAKIIGCATALVIFYSYELIMIWTKNIELSAQVAPILTILIIGNALTALCWMPFYAQIASGGYRSSIYINLISLLIAILLMPISIKNYGVIGAGYIWVVISAIHFFIGIYFIKIDIYKFDYKRWILIYNIKPILFINLFVLIYRWIMDKINPAFQTINLIILAGILFIFILASYKKSKCSHI